MSEDTTDEMRASAQTHGLSGLIASGRWTSAGLVTGQVS